MSSRAAAVSLLSLTVLLLTSCAARQPDVTPTPLGNTYWRIVMLQGEAVTAMEGRRDPHLILRPVDQQNNLSGTIGCNHLIGSYILAGDQIEFTALGGTKMACEPPLMALEQRLFAALGAARQWRITGNALELMDAAGARVLLFEAAQPR